MSNAIHVFLDMQGIELLEGDAPAPFEENDNLSTMV
jgi:hypothetical protein